MARKKVGPIGVGNVFDELLLKGIRSGQMPARSQEAREWFRKEARTKRPGPTKILASGEERLEDTSETGSMYFFMYDPKHKKTLPYYDKFPLIFPVEPAKGGFYGINFHYLPYVARAKLMDALYTITNNKRFDQSTRLKISYDLLKSAAKFSLFKPTFKHYLSKQVMSDFVKINPVEWDLPYSFQLRNSRRRQPHRFGMIP